MLIYILVGAFVMGAVGMVAMKTGVKRYRFGLTMLGILLIMSAIGIAEMVFLFGKDII